MTRIYNQSFCPESTVNETQDNSHSAWHNFAGLTVIIGLLAVPVFKGLWHLWHCDKNFGGFFLVPFMCGFILYRSKDEFTKCSPRQIKWILYLLPAALGVMFVASNYNFPRIASLLLAVNLLIASFGILGYSNYRLFVGPLIFLMLMVPPPQWAVDFVTVNLQRLFSAVMEGVLSNFSSLFLERHDFEFRFAGTDYSAIITPECSGIRSLLGFVIVSSFFAVFDGHSIVTAILMISAGVTVALMLNSLRMLATMQLKLCGLREYSIGSWHGLLGILAFMIGYMALGRLSRLLKPIDLKGHKEKK